MYRWQDVSVSCLCCCQVIIINKICVCVFVCVSLFLCCSQRYGEGSVLLPRNPQGSKQLHNEKETAGCLVTKPFHSYHMLFLYLLPVWCSPFDILQLCWRQLLIGNSVCKRLKSILFRHYFITMLAVVFNAMQKTNPSFFSHFSSI